MNKNLKGVDVGKLIAALLIILLHATECGDDIACEIKFALTRFSVPFFFITSGWLLSKIFENQTCAEQKKYIRKFTLKLLLLYGIWALIIYLPFTIYSYIHLPRYQDVELWYLICVIARNLFVVGSGPYWFIFALIGGSLWCYFTRNHTKIMTSTMLLTFLLLILYTNFRAYTESIMVIASFYRIIDLLYSWEFNFLTYGIPFCSLGYLLRKSKFDSSFISATIGFILFTIFRFLEYNYLSDYQISIAYIPQAVCFFYIALNYKPNITDSLSRKIRSLSSFIYFSHSIILYNILNPVLTFSRFPYTYAPVSILPKVIFVTIICCVLFFLLSRYKNWITKILINN